MAILMSMTSTRGRFVSEKSYFNYKHKKEICDGEKKTFHHKHEDGKIDFKVGNGNDDDISSCFLFYEIITLKYNHLMPM
jgi:hypothetical protein